MCYCRIFYKFFRVVIATARGRYHHEILHVGRTRVAVRFISIRWGSISNTFGPADESLNFWRSKAKNRIFSGKTYLVSQFLEYHTANGLVRNVMILRKILCSGIFDICDRLGENGLPTDHCRPKIRFFAVSGKTDFRSATSLCETLS